MSDWSFHVYNQLTRNDHPQYQLIGDTAWTTVSSFTNSWTAGGVAPAFILLGQVVYLRGTLLAGTANTAAFTLPVGYRHSAVNTFWIVATAPGSTTTNLVNVTSAGVVTPLNSGSTVLSSISFPVV